MSSDSSILRAVQGAVLTGIREITPIYERVVVGSFDPDDPDEPVYQEPEA